LIPKLRVARVALLFFLLPAILGPMILSIEHLSTVDPPRTKLQATGSTIGYSGLGPGDVSLNWTPSASLSFSQYVLRESTQSSSGPWLVIANIFNQANTSYYDVGLVPGATEWWQVIIYDPLSQTSNTLQVTQPPVAFLSYSQSTSTTAQLSWNNNAAYGGLLSFASYQLKESINGGVFFTAATISDVNSLGYTLRNLTPGANYSFYLNTTDQCNLCSGASLSSSASNIVTINPPSPLSASVASHPSTLDVGQSVSFSCVGSGGTPPYIYSWAFGDGIIGAGPTPSHIYNTTGTMNATCTVTDHLDSTASRSTYLIVSARPSIATIHAQPPTADLGDSVTFATIATGGSGTYTYSWTNLPPGCASANASSITCMPASSGKYGVTVLVTDSAGESAASTITISVNPQRVLGLPRETGLAVIFGSLGAIVLSGIIGATLTLQRRRQRSP
jgi:hypothetical protein